MARIKLNDRTVKAITPPKTGNKIDYDIQAGPRDTDYVRGFAVRTTAAGRRTFLLVYTTAEGRERRQRIGDYGPHTVTTARAEARRLRALVDAKQDPFADAKTARAEAEAKRSREGATLGALLEAYVASLRRRGKPSAKKVESELWRTVRDAHPDLWRSPAGNVTLDDLGRIVDSLNDAGKSRQAQKTRSYLRTAFTVATTVGGTGSATLFADFKHVVNVARDLGTIERPNATETGEPTKPAKRALSLAELSAYWRRIKAKPGLHGALLRFHLLTGAQRCEQLARLTKDRWDRDEKIVTLIDTKGRRTSPRLHVVPLLPEAEKALETMAGEAGPFLFTLDKGAHGAVYHTVRLAVAAVAAVMVEAGEIAATFTPGELRITVETRLAAAKVPRETRAHLQSHGLGGVQAVHYDKHNYLDEKRQALKKLRALLEPAGKVVRMPSRKRA